MSKAIAWRLAKPFIEDGTIEYFPNGLDFKMTGTNYALYKYQCEMNYILPLQCVKVDDGYMFSIEFKDMKEGL